MPGRVQPHTTQHSPAHTPGHGEGTKTPEEGKGKEQTEIKTSPTTSVTLASGSNSLSPLLVKLNYS